MNLDLWSVCPPNTFSDWSDESGKRFPRRIDMARNLRLLFVPVAGMISLLATAPSEAETPQYVDLRKVVNGNTDYIHIWPPVVFGDVERNGYRFHVIEPKTNNGKNVLAISGEKAARVPVSSAKGAYLYVLHHAVHEQKGAPPHYEHAVYSVQYADGSRVEIPIRDSRETHHWWTRDWWSQLKRDGRTSAWPFFLGRSYQSMKYGYSIGVWAMQWKNAHPDKAITGISFKPVSSSKSVIYAITITDADHFGNPDKNEHIRSRRNPGPPMPKDYFEAEIKAEQRASYKILRKQGLVKGVLEIDVIRPDTLAIRIDASIDRGVGLNEERAAAFQRSEAFTIASEDDPDYEDGTHPVKVGRLSLTHKTHQLPGIGSAKAYWHTYYLVLPAAMKSGMTYTATVKGLDEGLADTISINYQAESTVTPVIKVNQAAYSLAAKRRYAYLGWWAGDLGKVDYSEYKRFQVIDEKDGTVAHEGPITLLKADDECSGEDVYEMDLAPLARVGQYHIRIPGLGRSYNFGLGGKRAFNNFHVMMHGMLHHRCGCEVPEDISDWPHPACHVWNYENGHLVYGRSDQYLGSDSLPDEVPHKPDEPRKAFRGGYHDAMDSDQHYHHLLYKNRP